MSKCTNVKPIAAAIGTAFLASVASTQVATAAENPFGMTKLSEGYMVASEGKCGEGKCGGEMKSESEGKCGGEMKSESEGKCGGEMKSESEEKVETEGKCGEGKCGGKM